MDWPTYKALCDRGDVQSRFLLEETLVLLNRLPSDDLATVLVAELSTRPLPKPLDHRDQPLSDMFELCMTLQSANAIHDVVSSAEQSGADTPRTRNRGLAGFTAAWSEVCDMIAVRERRDRRE